MKRKLKAPSDGIKIAQMAAWVGDEKRAENIAIYDVRGYSDLCDYLVLMTVDSRAQANSIINDLQRRARTIHHEKPLAVEGSRESRWFVLDYIDVIVHIFSPDAREFYNLEGLWGDAPTVKIEFPAEPASK
ncbi:MAG: ribosome silencing factor [Planctomycetota bacterium]